MFTSLFGPILLFIIGIPLSLIALIALFSALILLLPEPIREVRKNLDTHPWRSIFLGILNVLGMGVIIFLVLSLIKFISYEWQPIFIGLIAVLCLLLAIPAMIGLSAVIITVGVRLGERPKPFFTYLRGGGLLLLACLAPFIGWFVFTPLIVFASLGSVMGLLAGLKKAAPAGLPGQESPGVE